MANFFDQFDAPPAPAQGANFFDQFDTPTAPQAAQQKTFMNLPEITLGRLGKPSLIGLAKSLFEGAQSAATLPRDVYQGKVDPTSEEGIHRTVDMAALTTLPSAGRSLAVPAVKAGPAVAELKAAAKPVFEEATKVGNTIPVEGTGIAKGIAEELHPQALRPASAPRTYNELNGLKRAGDLNDVAIARDNLRDVANGISENKLIRVAGEDSTAARKAMNMLDDKMEELSPGWTEKMKTADANWAAAKRIDKVVKEADKGQKGRLGSFDANETRAKGYTPEEIAAIKKAHQGGMLGTLFNNIGAHTNIFHGGLEGMLGGPLALAAKLPLTPLGMASDFIAKSLRQRAFNDAIDKIASRSPLAQQQGGGGLLQLPQIPLSPLPGLLPFTHPQSQ